MYLTRLAIYEEICIRPIDLLAQAKSYIQAMSLWNIGVEFTNCSHALVSITGDWIAHLLDLVEMP